MAPRAQWRRACSATDGIRTLTIDRQRAVYDKPRAIAIDHEILRLLDNLGAAERVRPFIAPFPASQHFGAKGQLIRRIDMVPEPYPLGYTPSMVFTQPPVEAALRQHAQAYPGVTVELGTELTSLSQTKRWRDVTPARRRVARPVPSRPTTSSPATAPPAAFGNSSALPFEDLVFDEPWLVVDLQVAEAALGKLPQTAAQFCDPARPTTFIIGPGQHRRFEIMLLPGEDPRVMEEPDQVWRLLQKWLTPADATLWRAASYRFHALVAAEWRRGRVLLAGDAAHQQPPFIGQGMCQGIRDVANLVWKLDRVLRGQSGAALLDSYGEERSAHVRELTTRIKAIGHVICERDPVAAEARDARILAEGNGEPRTITRQDIVPPLQHGLLATAPHAANGTLFPQPWVRTDAGRQLLDAACGVGWRLVLDGGNGLAARSGIDDRGARVGNAGHPNWCRLKVLRRTVSSTEEDGVVARWFGRHECAAAIVRPDHYVFGVSRDVPSLSAMMLELSSAPAMNQQKTK